MQVSRYRCKNRLAGLWFPGAGILFALLLVQTILGHYAVPNEVWSWFLPTIMPTLSLMVGVLVMDTFQRDPPRTTVDRFVYRLAFGLSAVYLVVVGATILLQPFATLPPSSC